MANIAVVCPDLPYPADSGGNIKSFFLLQHLCANHEVSLITALKGDSGRHLDGLRGALPLVEVVTARVDRPRSSVNFAKSVLQRRTLNEFRTHAADLEPLAAPILEAADAIVVDHLEVMQYVPEKHWSKTVFHTHNAEHQLWMRKSAITSSRVERLGAGIEGRRVAARERRYCNGVAAALAAPSDQAALEAIGATSARFHRTYHLNDDSKLALPDVEWADTGPLLFFLGTLTWEPNIDGLEWFVADVWPLVKQRQPDAELVIGGNHPPQSLLDSAAADDALSVVGFVDDPEEYFTRARVSLAPLRFGSGMKLKVLEALTRGIPVVTTPIGAESIDAVDGEHMFIADDAAGQADRVCRLLTEPDTWVAMRDAGRQLVRDRYTWDVVRRDFDAALATVLG